MFVGIDASVHIQYASYYTDVARIRNITKISIGKVREQLVSSLKIRRRARDDTIDFIPLLRHQAYYHYL